MTSIFYQSVYFKKKSSPDIKFNKMLSFSKVFQITQITMFSIRATEKEKNTDFIRLYLQAFVFKIENRM